MPAASKRRGIACLSGLAAVVIMSAMASTDSPQFTQSCEYPYGDDLNTAAVFTVNTGNGGVSDCSDVNITFFNPTYIDFDLSDTWGWDPDNGYNIGRNFVLWVTRRRHASAGGYTDTIIAADWKYNMDTFGTNAIEFGALRIGPTSGHTKAIELIDYIGTCDLTGSPTPYQCAQDALADGNNHYHEEARLCLKIGMNFSGPCTDLVGLSPSPSPLPAALSVALALGERRPLSRATTLRAQPTGFR